MALDVQSILGGLTLGDEDKAAVTALFARNPAALKQIEDKFSELTAPVEAERATLASDRAKLEAEWDTLQSYRGNDQKTVDEMEARIEKLASQVAVGEHRVRKIASEAGIDPEPYLKDVTAVVPEKKEPVVTSQMDTTAVLQKAGAMAWNGTKMAAHLFDVAQEHMALFGTPLKDTEGLLDKLSEEARRTNNPHVTPRAIWEKEYHVAAKRSEIAEATVQTRIKAEVEKALMAERDAASLRGGGPGQPPSLDYERSPIFASLDEKKEHAVQVRGVDPGVSAAILAFRKIRAGEKVA